jgi:germination protein M
MLLTLAFSAVILLLAGCGKQEGDSYSVYYKNAAGTKLVTSQYVTDTKDSTALISELIGQMGKSQKKDDCVSLKPENLTLEKAEIVQNVAYVYFNKDYDKMEVSEELLFRAGVVKLITQIDGIEYVRFFVDGSAASYKDGSHIGLMSPLDFVDDSNEKLESVEWKTVTLYFANKLGTQLVTKNETIAVGKSTSLERILVETLIKGTSDQTMTSTLPSDLKVLSVSVSDGVCYVNLSSVFITEMVNVSSEIPIYSIVNTLCTLDNIDSVKIMINGDSTRSYRETISLETTFSFNKELVESGN